MRGDIRLIRPVRHTRHTRSTQRPPGCRAAGSASHRRVRGADVDDLGLRAQQRPQDRHLAGRSSPLPHTTVRDPSVNVTRSALLTVREVTPPEMSSGRAWSSAREDCSAPGVVPFEPVAVTTGTPFGAARTTRERDALGIHDLQSTLRVLHDERGGAGDDVDRQRARPGAPHRHLRDGDPLAHAVGHGIRVDAGEGGPRGGQPRAAHRRRLRPGDPGRPRRRDAEHRAPADDPHGEGERRGDGEPQQPPLPGPAAVGQGPLPKRLASSATSGRGGWCRGS